MSSRKRRTTVIVIMLLIVACVWLVFIGDNLQKDAAIENKKQDICITNNNEFLYKKIQCNKEDCKTDYYDEDGNRLQMECDHSPLVGCSNRAQVWSVVSCIEQSGSNREDKTKLTEILQAREECKGSFYIFKETRKCCELWTWLDSKSGECGLNFAWACEQNWWVIVWLGWLVPPDTCKPQNHNMCNKKNFREICINRSEEIYQKIDKIGHEYILLDNKTVQVFESTLVHVENGRVLVEPIIKNEGKTLLNLDNTNTELYQQVWEYRLDFSYNQGVTSLNISFNQWTTGDKEKAELEKETSTKTKIGESSFYQDDKNVYALRGPIGSPTKYTNLNLEPNNVRRVECFKENVPAITNSQKSTLWINKAWWAPYTGHLFQYEEYDNSSCYYEQVDSGDWYILIYFGDGKNKRHQGGTLEKLESPTNLVWDIKKYTDTPTLVTDGKNIYSRGALLQECTPQNASVSIIEGTEPKKYKINCNEYSYTIDYINCGWDFCRMLEQK